jgi:autotransporter-associated beta strand protein
MKAKGFSMAGLISWSFLIPASADVIYSNLQNIAIPTNFSGVYLNVETGGSNTNINSPQAGWDVNPFFGGSVMWNSPTFQPVRTGTGEMDAVVNVADGSTVGSGSTYSTFVQGSGGENPGGPGYGISETHMGAGVGQFVSGSEGYLGFRLNGEDYGYMRVVLTNNTSGAVIKDWAYDTSGASVVVGGIRQVGQDVTLSSGFTLASAVVNSGGTTNLVKNGSGTNTLSATSTYTGSTTVNEGKLLITGSLANTSSVTVNDGATLGGNGSIAGPVTLNSGATISAGEGIDTLTTGSNTWNSGSSLLFQFSTDGSSGTAGGEWDSLGINGDLDLSGVTSGDPFTIALVSMSDGTTTGLLGSWDANSNATWSGIVTTTGSITGFAGDKFLVDTTNFQNSYTGSFSVVANGSNLDLVYTAVPEPKAALIGSLGLLMLLRRRPRH